MSSDFEAGSDTTSVILGLRQRRLVAQAGEFEEFVHRSVGELTSASYETRVIENGVTNRVSRVTTSTGHHFICRLHISNEPWFEQEVDVLVKAQRSGIPVPGVVSLSHARQGGSVASLLIETVVEGEPMLEMMRHGMTSIVEATRLCRDAADVLQQIHGLTPGCTKQAQLPVIDPATIKEVHPHDGSLDSLSGRDTELIEQIGERCAVVIPPVLAVTHGDFDTKHLMVRRDSSGQLELAGVIDWEEAALRDPLYDYARWSFWGVRPSLTESLGGTAGLQCLYGSDAFERYRDQIAVAAINALAWEQKYLGGVTRTTLELAHRVVLRG